MRRHSGPSNGAISSFAALSFLLFVFIDVVGKQLVFQRQRVGEAAATLLVIVFPKMMLESVNLEQSLQTQLGIESSCICISSNFNQTRKTSCKSGLLDA